MPISSVVTRVLVGVDDLGLPLRWGTGTANLVLEPTIIYGGYRPGVALKGKESVLLA